MKIPGFFVWPKGILQTSLYLAFKAKGASKELVLQPFDMLPHQLHLALMQLISSLP
jgi:hypothetical protein